jgi:DNA-binding GntR family transcriptional regulator
MQRRRPSASRSAKAKPSSAAPIAEGIMQALTREVAEGDLAPGAKLDEQSLATRFGVSRTPVREAIRMMAANGLLDNRGRRGVYVTQISPEELAEMFEAMTEIEALCAMLAAHRMSLFERLQLEEAHRQCRLACEANDPRAYIRCNDSFHETIYRGTHNRYIADMARNFRFRTAPFRNVRFADAESLSASYEAHTQIVKSINSSQSNDAYAVMRTHSSRSGQTAMQGELLDRAQNTTSE